MLLITTSAAAEVKKLNLELKRLPFQRDYYIPERTNWDYEVTLNMDLEKFLFCYPLGEYQSNCVNFFLESDLTGQSANSRFRNLWWDYTVGLSILPDVDIIWDHRSQHALDEKTDFANDKYPVRDSYGIRLNFKKLID